jgi:hypothetical protein
MVRSSERTERRGNLEGEWSPIALSRIYGFFNRHVILMACEANVSPDPPVAVLVID